MTEARTPEARAAEDAAVLTRFFHERLLPLAQHPAWQASPAGPQPEQPSYWISRGNRLVTADDFRLAPADATGIARALDAQWRGTALAGLGAPLAAMSTRFRGREQKDAVSSFVYEMF